MFSSMAVRVSMSVSDKVCAIDVEGMDDDNFTRLELHQVFSF